MSAAEITAWVGALGIVPWVWSALVALLRVRAAGAEAPLNDGQEKVVLTAMLAPIALGAALLLAPREAVTALAPPLLDLPDFATAPAEAAAASDVEPTIHWAPLIGSALPMLYMAGFARFAAPLAAAHWRLRRWVAEARPHTDLRGVLISDFAPTPIAASRNRVLFPAALAATLTREQISLIVDHERRHHVRGDVAYYALLAWVEALLWFNPFVRNQARNCRFAAELDCDAVVTAAAPEMRRAYAQTLLAVLKHTAGDALPCAPAVFSHRSLGEHRMRIMHIMKRQAEARKRTPWLACAAALALAAPIGAAQMALAQTSGEATPVSSSAPAFTHTPHAGRISSGFGERPDPTTGERRHHDGIDIVGQQGDAIVAPASGRVARVVRDHAGYGNMLEIDHGGGYVVRYAQLSAFDVADGDAVRAGQVIARVGSSGRAATGPHLHLEVWRDGVALDPASVLPLPQAR